MSTFTFNTHTLTRTLTCNSVFLHCGITTITSITKISEFFF